MGEWVLVEGCEDEADWGSRLISGDEDDWRMVPWTVDVDGDDGGLSCGPVSGLDTPMVLPSSWLTSEFALERGRSGSSANKAERGASGASSFQDSLMCSVNKDRMENKDDSVPPVDTSLTRL